MKAVPTQNQLKIFQLITQDGVFMKKIPISSHSAPFAETLLPKMFFLTCVGILFAANLSFPNKALSQDYPPIVTEINMRKAILEQGVTFSDQELEDMDLNNDNVLNVADLVMYVNQNTLPLAVSFINTQSNANEKNNTLEIGVEYTQEYSGDLHYIVEGTAVSGEDFTPLSGSLPVDNRLEYINLNFIDDIDIEDVETLIITLIPDIGYQIGVSQQHIIYLYDNDATWRGNLQIDNMLMGFNVALAQTGSSYQATVNSDGSNGFPAGTWPANAIISENDFALTIGPINIIPEKTLLAADFSRTILLTAQTTDSNHIMDLNGLIQGDMVEEITASKPQFSRLGSNAITGSFTLVKDPDFVPVAPSGLEDLN